MGLLVRLVNAVEPDAPPPARWLTPDWPRGLALLASPLVPAYLSAPVRAATGLPALPSLAVAVPLAIALLWPFLPALRARVRLDERRLWLGAAPLLLAALAVGELWTPWFDGLPSVGGGDSGNHVLIGRAFGAPGPPGYRGCVGLHAVAYWLGRLAGLDTFAAFRLTLYASLALVIATPVVVGLASLRDAPPVAFRMGALVGVAAVAAAARSFLLPLASYQQADGYWAHFFGLVPLCLLWLVDVLVVPRLLRLLAFLILLVLSRYTYALNLGDTMLATALLLVLESGQLGPWCWPVRLNAAALAAASALVYRALRPVLDLSGAMVHYDRDVLVRGLWGALALLALMVLVDRQGTGRARPPLPGAARAGSGAAPHSPPDGRGDRTDRLASSVRVPLLVGGVGVVAWAVLRRLPLAEDYYLDKYSLVPAVLLTSGACAALPRLVARVAPALAERRHRARAAATLALLATAFLWVGRDFARATAVYRPTYLERRAGTPPFRFMRALADREADRRIDATLAARHARFGGYLTSSWPMSNFMNAARGATDGSYTSYAAPRADHGAGACVFWEGPGDGWGDYEGQPARAALQADPEHSCETYPTPWNPGSTRSLCHRCY